MRRHRPRSPALMLCLALAGAAGCGSSEERLAPAAEPARSPPTQVRPAGRVVPVGNKPEGLAYDRRTGILAVGLTKPDGVALVDGRSGRVLRRVRLRGAPRHLQLARPGGPVLVPSEGSDELVQVQLPSGRVSARARVGRQPHDAAPGRAGRVLVGDELGDSLSVVQGSRRVARLPAPVQPGGVATSPDGRRAAVVGVSERALELFDTQRLRSLGKIDVGIGPTHLLALRSRFFVVDTRGNALLEVRTRPRLRIHRRTALPGTPYGIALDQPRGRIWVTLTATNQLAELTAKRVLRLIPAVRQPNSVAVDHVSGRVFVASRKDGTLQILDPARVRGRRFGR